MRPEERDEKDKDDLERAVEVLNLDIAGLKDVWWDGWLAVGRYHLRQEIYERGVEIVERYLSRVKAASASQPKGKRHWTYRPSVKIRGWNVDIRWTKYGYPGAGEKPMLRPFHAQPHERSGKIPISKFTDTYGWEKDLIAQCEEELTQLRLCKRHLTSINRANQYLKEWLGHPTIQAPPVHERKPRRGDD